MAVPSHLVVETTVGDDIDCFDDVWMLESGADTELCGNLFLVFLLGLTVSLWPELLDSIDDATALVAGLYETDGATGSTAEDTAQFAILLREMDLGRVAETRWGSGMATR